MTFHPETYQITSQAAARVMATCDNPIVKEALRGLAVYNMFMAQHLGAEQSPIMDYLRPFEKPDPDRLLMFKRAGH